MKEKSNSIGLIVSFIVIICLILFICYDKGIILKDNKKITNNDVTEKENNVINSKDSLIIDSNNCLNCNITEITSSFSSNKNNVGIITFDIDSYNQKALTNYTLNNTIIEYNFDKSIVETMVYNIGQEELYPIVLYLMEDGTINYVNIYVGLENNDLSKYTTISNVDDVIKLYPTTVCGLEYCSANTILAQKKDGTFYDLSSLINNH